MDELIFTINGIIDRWGYSKNYVQYYLNNAKGKAVRVRVNSSGGDVNEAIAISQLFADHGNVTVEFIGFNASAATWMAFGAKKIEMHEDGFYLAHHSSIPVDIYGLLKAKDIDQKINELKSKKSSTEAIDLMIAQKYVNRTDKALKDVLSLMNEDKWITAKDAKEWGFIDVILPASDIKDVQGLNCVNVEQMQAFGLPALNSVEGDPKDDSKNEPKDDLKNDSKTIVQQIVEGIRDVFTPKKEKALNTNSNNIVMNKEFTFVNAILQVEGIEEKDGVVTLNKEQLTAINNAIKDADEKAKKAEDSHSNFVGKLDAISDSVKSAADTDAKIEVIKNIIAKIPATVVTDNNGQNGTTDFADVAVDPINNYGMED